MKKRSQARTWGNAETGPQGGLRTGDHCPVSGWWASEVEPQAPRFISEGSVMPTHHGVAVSWTRVPVVVGIQAKEGLASFGGPTLA